jgi:hypothetical protein
MGERRSPVKSHWHWGELHVELEDLKTCLLDGCCVARLLPSCSLHRSPSSVCQVLLYSFFLLILIFTLALTLTLPRWSSQGGRCTFFNKGQGNTPRIPIRQDSTLVGWLLWLLNAAACQSVQSSLPPRLFPLHHTIHDLHLDHFPFTTSSSTPWSTADLHFLTRL